MSFHFTFLSYLSFLMRSWDLKCISIIETLIKSMFSFISFSFSTPSTYLWTSEKGKRETIFIRDKKHVQLIVKKILMKFIWKFWIYVHDFVPQIFFLLFYLAAKNNFGRSITFWLRQEENCSWRILRESLFR